MKRMAMLLGAALGWVFVAGTSQAGSSHAASDSTAAHERAWEAWRKERMESLARPDGWLSLAGLYFLKPGENGFGSDEKNLVRFPAKAPASMGTFTLADGRVHVRVLPGVSVTMDGKPVTEMDLKSDNDGQPTVLHMGTLSWFVLQRTDRFAIRIRDTESPELHAFKGVPSYPYAEGWRVVAGWEPYDPPKQLQITNIVGQAYQLPCPGAYVFEKNGATYRLEPTLEGNELFLVFSDGTTGRDTYGGGRFVYTALPGPDGKVVLDFNRAYNPPCAFTPWATCPLPTAQNKLALKLEAGEKLNPHGVVAPGHTVN